jgi:hypothetical protein
MFNQLNYLLAELMLPTRGSCSLLLHMARHDLLAATVILAMFRLPASKAQRLGCEGYLLPVSPVPALHAHGLKLHGSVVVEVNPSLDSATCMCRMRHPVCLICKLSPHLLSRGRTYKMCERRKWLRAW